MQSRVANAGSDNAPPVFSTGRVILWWELRRLLYNFALLVIGLPAVLGMMLLMEKAHPHVDDDFLPFLGIVLYGFMANLCYTLGWSVELMGRRTDPVSARARGQWMFRAGMVFSCLLTSLPFWFGCVYWALNRAHAR